MDFRIGANIPIYSTKYVSKVTDRALQASFARMMAETKASGMRTEGTKTVRQENVENSGDSLEKRLERVHQKIDGMDFSGKYDYEIYRSIYDAYEEEFGYLDLHFYLDRDTIDKDPHDIIYEDRDAMYASKIRGYDSKNIRFYRYAMGYDKMSKEEIIRSIKERVGGNSYVHRICEINELKRAGILTPAQGHSLYCSLERQAGKEYCAEMGFDYIKWSSDPEQYYANPYGDGIPGWDINFMAWAAKTETTWLKVIDSIHDYDPMWEWQRNALLEELKETSELLIKSDNV